jgi:dual-specificity kinase
MLNSSSASSYLNSPVAQSSSAITNTTPGSAATKTPTAHNVPPAININTSFIINPVQTPVSSFSSSFRNFHFSPFYQLPPLNLSPSMPVAASITNSTSGTHSASSTSNSTSNSPNTNIISTNNSSPFLYSSNQSTKGNYLSSLNPPSVSAPAAHVNNQLHGVYHYYPSPTGVSAPTAIATPYPLMPAAVAVSSPLHSQPDQATLPHQLPPSQQQQHQQQHQLQQQPLPYCVPLAATAQQSTAERRKRKQPNWEEFYKNGYPEEIVVISDDDGDDGELTTLDTITNTVKRKRILTSSDPQPYKKPCISTIQQQHHHQPHQQLLAVVNPPPPLLPRQIIKPKDIRVPLILDYNPSLQVDDADGHLDVTKHKSLANGRYVIQKVLGQGTFGKVVSAYDTTKRTLCAVKIIRAIPKYRDASKIELRVLTAIAKYDRENQYQCIHLRECFDYKNHVCLVTDLLDVSIYDFLKSNKYQPFPYAHVKAFARQLFASVAYLHNLGLVHTDLKPENILLKDSRATTVNTIDARGKPSTRKLLRDPTICLIDFGSAIFDDEYHNHIVSTRHYRAPEIILNVGWSFPCDIWSIGCILVEFCTGEALFQTHDNREHLALMEKIIGKSLDRGLLRKAARNTADLVIAPSRSAASGNNSDGNEHYRINYPNKETKKGSERQVRQTKSLTALFREVVIPGIGVDQPQRHWDLFLDLLQRIFVYDQRKRISAREALEHPFLA